MATSNDTVPLESFLDSLSTLLDKQYLSNATVAKCIRLVNCTDSQLNKEQYLVLSKLVTEQTASFERKVWYKLVYTILSLI